MADFTMCASERCPVRGTCYRQKAKASENQSWCNFEYTCNENNGFIDYMALTVKENINIIKSSVLKCP